MNFSGKYYLMALSLGWALEASAQTATVTYRLDSSWGTGLQAGLTVINTGTTTLTNWTLTFDYPHNITSIWDARIRSKTGNRYVLEGPNWNRSLPPGGQAWIGWIASLSTAPVAPSGCTMPGTTLQSNCAAGGGGGTPADTTPPTVPGNLRSSAQTATTITLQWNASTDTGSGVAGYDVRRGTAVIGTTTQPTYTATGLTAGTSYTFSVRARDTAGNASAYTTGVTVATTAAPTCTQAPAAAPTGLAVSNIAANSAQLTWNAVTPAPGCTIGYRVWLNGSQLPASLSTPGYMLSGLTASTPYSVAVAAFNQIGSTLASTAVNFRTANPPPPVVSGTFPPRVFAPYADMLLWPTPNLASIAQQTGVKYFTAAFVVSGAPCQASWGGVVPVTDNFLVPEIDALRAAGGDVIVSFGGAIGVELAQSCTTVAALQAQYQFVIDKFRLTRIDFDIEGGAIGDTASIDRRNKAIAGLQAAARAAGRPLTVQYTLPVLPTGLTFHGVALLQNTVQNNVDLGILNIMAMDYGNSVADPNRMGQAAIDAVNSTFAQMKAAYGTTKTDAQLRAMQGVTPMIGLNDVVPEVFTLGTDAPMLLNFATTNRLGLLSMWSVGRDKQCPGSPQVSPTCSGVTQANNAFMNVFFPFTVQ